MQNTISHPTYGIITYDESFWTGKKTILFDGIPLQKVSKNTYLLPANPADPESNPVTFTVKGNMVGGVTITNGTETITLFQKATATDYILGILPAVLFFLFILQGAIGGAIAGMMSVGGILLMKTRPNMKQKLLISLGASAVILAIGVTIIVLTVMASLAA